MGARGPVPALEIDLARPRYRKGSEQGMPVTKGERHEVRDWSPDSKWSPLAKDLFGSVATSGQSDFYQDSDWIVLKLVCEEITRFQKSPELRARGQWLSAIQSLMTNLLLTEGDRRRVRIELTEPAKVNPGFTLISMKEYGEALK